MELRELGKISQEVDRAFDDEVRFLVAMVRQASDNPPGDCAPHAKLAARELETRGFTVERHVVPAARAAASGMRSAVNLIVRERFGPGPIIALSAHGDVVPPGEGWTEDPYGGAVRAGALYGRGAAVSKSDFATYGFALLALKRAGIALAGTIELHFTYDEESGGAIGPELLLAEGIVRPDAVIYAGFSHAIATAHKGCLHLEVEFRGRSAHAAEPWRGRDALEAAHAALAALYAHRKTLSGRAGAFPGIGSPSLVVGTIGGGINTNVVPDRITLRLDRRLLPEEDEGAVERDLSALVRAAGAGEGIEIGVRRLMLARPLVPVLGTDRLVEILRARAEAAIGAPVPVIGLPLYTDARHYAAAGIPVVIYGAGPRTLAEAGGHGPDEHVRLEDLRLATCVVAETLADLLDPKAPFRLSPPAAGTRTA
ncbi:MAG: M20/M25/M40 family metallo-hydrolase [Alphaproteobacteria bacterium]